MIQMHLSNVQIQWMMFMRILMITIQSEKKSIVFDDVIADIMSNKKFQAIIKELFIRCRNINISLVFITQSCFSVPKDVRFNTTIISSLKQTTKENDKILQLIILQTLIIKVLRKFIENVQKNLLIF